MSIKLPSRWPSFLAFALWLIPVLLLSGGVALAQGLPYDEEEAQAIDRSLMCPVCPAETIDQAQVELARQMREVVRDMLAQGSSRAEILDFFVDRYGTGVLAAPPKSGVNLLAWIMPVAGVVLALLGALAILRSMRAGGGRNPATGPSLEDGLEPYLETVDRDLALLHAEVPAGRRSASMMPESGGETRGASEPGVGIEPLRGEATQLEDDT
ncbi:MAG: cytochrome c-type biogenesis protein CcmH [Dehalococcoidia bacterium]|jgi:cytochrome c-type biogenesis protein CcmH|nr:cytochrome c-type biogenesis protein CcmH [Dehalococcoidia bacterium]